MESPEEARLCLEMSLVQLQTKFKLKIATHSQYDKDNASFSKVSKTGIPKIKLE